MYLQKKKIEFLHSYQMRKMQKLSVPTMGPEYPVHTNTIVFSKVPKTSSFGGMFLVMYLETFSSAASEKLSFWVLTLSFRKMLSFLAS